MFRNVQHKSGFVQVRVKWTYVQLFTYTQPDWLQHCLLTTCVIAQQYSATTFVSLHFYSYKKKLDARFQHIINSVFKFFIKLCKFEISH
jgi:hypothetical protein